MTDGRTAGILARLDEVYGTSLKCYLTHEDAWQLLVATELSAQCTDARVNQVTPALFARYPGPAEMAAADPAELEELIRSTGFYHNKAAHLIACARTLTEEYGGEVPSDIEALVKLPGVGRKTANVIRGNIFGIPSIVVDTHVGRLARRLGWTEETDPVKVEYALMEKIPEDHWILLNLDLIALGRTFCQSRKPDCGGCFLREECPEAARRLSAEQ